MPDLDEQAVASTEDLLATHRHGPAGGRQAQELEGAGVRPRHGPSSGDEVVVFERDVERESEIGEGGTNRARCPQVAVATRGLARNRVVVDQVLVQQ